MKTLGAQFHGGASGLEPLGDRGPLQLEITLQSQTPAETGPAQELTVELGRQTHKQSSPDTCRLAACPRRWSGRRVGEPDKGLPSWIGGNTVKRKRK